ncbi:MAG: hypothetical protein J5971_04070 [Prevotella sp.]|nr:hypothetical protein [Prevotella sp.]
MKKQYIIPTVRYERMDMEFAMLAASNGEGFTGVQMDLNASTMENGDGNDAARDMLPQNTSVWDD